MIKLGWKAGTEQFPPDQLLDFATAAEEAGFDSIDASDHFHPWAESGQACFVWTWLGALAAKTNKITFGTGITCPILRYHPAVVAQAAATVAALAPERFFLGVGTGEALNEYSAVGQWPGYNIRRRQLGEAIELIRKLWSGEKITHRGEYYQTRDAKLYTLPGQPISIYISTMVPASARFAGKYGDGLITVGGEDPRHLSWHFRKLRFRRYGGRPRARARAADDRDRGRIYRQSGKGDRKQKEVLGRNFRACFVHRKDLHAADVRAERQGRGLGYDQRSGLHLH
jgi:G6PDH family F420-dependent oxidoreductase